MSYVLFKEPAVDEMFEFIVMGGIVCIIIGLVVGVAIALNTMPCACVG